MIHPSAVVSPLADIGQGVSIGPYSIIEECAVIGDNCKIESHVHIYSNTRIGNGCHIYDGAIVGSNPQDLSYTDETTWLTIGERSTIREYCTINRAAREQAHTRIGNDVLLMAYSHVGHDSIISDHAVLANGVQLGGHVEIGFGAVIGGMTAIQQFCRIGALAFVGGTLKADKDVPPYSKALGNPLTWGGLNLKALERHSIAHTESTEINKLYKELYRSNLTVQEFVAFLSSRPQDNQIIQEFIAYFSKPVRGIIRPRS